MPDYQVDLNAEMDRFVTEDDLVDFWSPEKGGRRRLRERSFSSAPMSMARP